jgi:hypothetical protein
MQFSIAYRNSPKWIAAAAGLAVSAAIIASAQAGEIRKPKEEEMRSVYLVKYRANNEIQYTRKSAGKVVKVSASRYLNSNPYVCTPSGFGQKARCYVPNAPKRPNV